MADLGSFDGSQYKNFKTTVNTCWLLARERKTDGNS